jgi:hypothetical protein
VPTQRNRTREKYKLSTENLLTENNVAVSGKAPHGIKLRPPKENDLFVNTEIGGESRFDVLSEQIILR